MGNFIHPSKSNKKLYQIKGNNKQLKKKLSKDLLLKLKLALRKKVIEKEVKISRILIQSKLQ